MLVLVGPVENCRGPWVANVDHRECRARAAPRRGTCPRPAEWDLDPPHVLGFLRPRVRVDREPPDFPGLGTRLVGGAGQVPGEPALVIGQWRFSVPWWVSGMPIAGAMMKAELERGCPATLCGSSLPGLWSAGSSELFSCAPALSSVLAESTLAATFPSGPPASASAPAPVSPAASSPVAPPPWDAARAGNRGEGLLVK